MGKLFFYFSTALLADWGHDGYGPASADPSRQLQLLLGVPAAAAAGTIRLRAAAASTAPNVGSAPATSTTGAA